MRAALHSSWAIQRPLVTVCSTSRIKMVGTTSGGAYCAAFGCGHSQQKCRQIHFFRFPADKGRSKRWVVNCRRGDLLSATTEYLNKNCRLCQDHFEASQFMNSKQDRLIWNAVPTLFTGVPNPPKKLTLSRPLPVRVAKKTPVDRHWQISPLRLHEEHAYSRRDIKATTTHTIQKPRETKNAYLTSKTIHLQKKAQATKNETLKQPLATPEEIVQAARNIGLDSDVADLFLAELKRCTSTTTVPDACGVTKV